MYVIRICVHSLVLTMSNIAGILVGFVAWRALGAMNQLAVQVPIATISSLLLFVAWTRLALIAPLKSLTIKRAREFMLVFLAALVWNPAVFALLHYITQGYLTSSGNIMALLLFQVPVNVVAVTLALRMADTLRSGQRHQEPADPAATPTR